MKAFLIALLLFGIIFQAQSQSKPLANTPAQLVKKSDGQYKAAWILLGTGTVMIIGSLAITPNYDDYYNTTNQGLITGLALAGTVSFVVSVPLFLSAGSNARMAARISLQNQALHQPAFAPGQPRNIPALSLKIPL